LEWGWPGLAGAGFAAMSRDNYSKIHYYIPEFQMAGIGITQFAIF